MTAPIRIRMRWLDFSPALHAYAERRVRTALRRFPHAIDAVEVQVIDDNGPRGGADDKVCRIEMHLRPSGRLIASATANDLREAVDRAAGRAKTVVRRHLAQQRALSEGERITRIG